ncbi:MAG: type II secretion system protein GspK [Planctomycetota bacterium]
MKSRGENKYESIADLISKESPEKAKGRSKKKPDEAEPLDLQTFSDIADKVTVTGEGEIPGRININTAPKTVLAALLGADERAERLADDIIAHREGLIGGMQSVADVMNVGSVSIDTFKKIANYITTRSDVFTIRCFATADRAGVSGIRLQTEGVVDRSERPCRVLYWYQGAGN